MNESIQNFGNQLSLPNQQILAAETISDVHHDRSANIKKPTKQQSKPQ